MVARRVCCRSSGRWTLMAMEVKEDAASKFERRKTARRRRMLRKERLFDDYGISSEKEIPIGLMKLVFERGIMNAR
jgi:hypothetical protein